MNGDGWGLLVTRARQQGGIVQKDMVQATEVKFTGGHPVKY